MRSLLTLLVVTSLVGSARADGPDEPRQNQPATEQAPPAAVVTPEPAPAPAVVAPAPKNDEEVIANPSKKWGFAFLGIAAGSFLITAATGGAALAESSKQEGNPANPGNYTHDLAASAQSGKDLATVSYVFIGFGATMAIIDAVIWYECLRKPRSIKKNLASSMLSPAGVRF